MKKIQLFSIFFVGFILVGCDTSVKPATRHSDVKDKSLASKPQGVEENPFNPFYVYQDKGFRGNHYTPSGFMPDGKCVVLQDGFMEKCFSGETCIKIVYDVECSEKGQRWAGIYWLNPPSNWGQRKGGFNLQGANRLTFHARGERGGEVIQEFTIGGIAGAYPDSDMVIMGPVILSKEWREYVIDLRGRDLSYISGGFAWTTNTDANEKAVTFYLDEIKFE